MDVLFYIVLALLTGTLLTAAFYDLIRFTLPNEISLIVLALFVFAALLQFSVPVIVSHLASGVIVFLVTFVKWHLRLIYGGDVKLWAATACFFPLSDLLQQVIAVILVGGLFTLLMVALRHGLAFYVRKAGREELQAMLPEGLKVGGQVPYGFAIAAGTLWALFTSAPGLFSPVLSATYEGSALMVISSLVGGLLQLVLAPFGVV